MPVPDFTQGLEEVERFASRPLEGKRIGIIRETIGEGVSPGVNAAFDRAAQHLATLGAEVHEVECPFQTLWHEPAYEPLGGAFSTHI